MSYYGYVAPDITKEVNWAKIGTDFADMLNKGEADREAKRKEIDAETDKVIKAINETPQGQHQGIKEWSLKFGSSASKQMLMLNKELKAGRLRPDDFIRYRQNLKDGTDSIYNLAKTYQAEYAKKEELKRKGELSYADSYLMAMTESLGQFSETEAYINPVDSKVYLAKLKDGVVDTNPYNLQSPSVLTGLLTTTYEKFKVMDEAKKVAEAAGKDIRVVSDAKRRIIKDPTQKKDLRDIAKTDADIGLYMRLEDAAISAALYNDDRIMSVLTDSKNINPKTGNVYDLTTDPDDPGIKTGDKIYMEFDKGSGRLTPKPTKEQREVAEDVMRDAIRYQLDYEEEARQEFAPQRSTGGTPRGGTPDDKTAATMLRYLYSGNDVEMQQAKQYFQLRGSVIERTPTGVNVTRTDKDGNTRTFPISFTTPDGQVLPEIGWAQSAAPILTGDLDVNEVFKYGGKGGSLGALNTTTTFTTAPAPGTQGPSKKTVWVNTVRGLIPEKYYGGSTKNAKKTITNLAANFGQYGFTFDTDGPVIKITTPSSGTIEIDTEIEGYGKAITDALKNGLTGEKLDAAFKAAKFNK